MQLVFNNGLESPMFDTKSKSTTEVKTAQIKDSKIAKIHANIGSNCIDYRAQVEYEDGSRSNIYDEEAGAYN